MHAVCINQTVLQPCSSHLSTVWALEKKLKGTQSGYYPRRPWHSDTFDIGCTLHGKVPTQYAELAEIRYKGIIDPTIMYKHASDLQSANPTLIYRLLAPSPNPLHHHTTTLPYSLLIIPIIPTPPRPPLSPQFPIPKHILHRSRQVLLTSMVLALHAHRLRLSAVGDDHGG
jgi:hypothetical protein